MSVENKVSYLLVVVIVIYVCFKGVELLENVVNFEVIVGEGVFVEVDGYIIYIGNVWMVVWFGWDIGV